MTRAALIFCTALAPLSPAAAEDVVPPGAGRAQIEDGAGLLGEGARLLMRGFLEEIEPQMRKLAEAMRNWEIDGLQIDDLGNYHAPELLPNGDIIIRRKDPKKFEVPPFARDSDSEIEI